MPVLFFFVVSWSKVGRKASTTGEIQRLAVRQLAGAAIYAM